MKFHRNARFVLLLLAVAALLCGCSSSRNENVYAKLLSAFEKAGYPAQLRELDPETPVPIYNASVWKALDAGGDTVLVYFDESNRADYLLTMMDQGTDSLCTHMGQRFILVYQGNNPDLIAFLETV